MNLITIAAALFRTHTYFARVDDFAPFGLFAVWGVFICGILCFSLAIKAVVCYIVSALFKRVPPEHRKQNPNLVWLLFIPFFALVWVWFVYPKLSESYQSWARAAGRNEIGDAYGTLAMILCISIDCCIVPCLNYLAGPAALVMLIVFLVQISGLKDRIAPPA